MLVVMNSHATEKDIKRVALFLESKGFEARVSHGEARTVVHAIGIKEVDQRDFELLHGVDEVIKLSTNYKLAARACQGKDTVVEVNGVKFGDKYTGLIAGPCTVESYDQMDATAQELAESNVKIIRGGAFKPRTSPYSFQGLELDGLKLLKKAKEATGLPIVTELMSTDYIDEFVENVDVIQIGARNMQNFDLLKQVGRTKTPILLNRGLSASIEEWLMAAEYIMAGGNDNVILCERGIRTFETATRNTLDLSAIPVIKRLSHLPVIVDPSHATGYWYLVEPLAKAAIMAGADGLMVEVHNDPKNALSDGQQSIKPESFEKLMNEIKRIAEFEGKVI